MKERTLEAMAKAEEFFCEVIEEEADGNTTAGRTEQMHWAVEGLEGLACIRYKLWKAQHIMNKMHNPVEEKTTTVAGMTLNYK